VVSGGQVQVNHQEVSDAGAKAGEKTGDAENIKAKIASAQVEDGSWGLVGKITEGSYKDLLSQLNDHMNQMSQGIQNLADTIKKIADNYKENEDAINDSFKDIETKLADAPKAPTAHAEGA
jgi:uncharacterized protein YukE